MMVRTPDRLFDKQPASFLPPPYPLHRPGPRTICCLMLAILLRVPSDSP